MSCRLHLPWIYDLLRDLMRCDCGAVQITRVEADQTGRGRGDTDSSSSLSSTADPWPDRAALVAFLEQEIWQADPGDQPDVHPEARRLAEWKITHLRALRDVLQAPPAPAEYFESRRPDGDGPSVADSAANASTAAGHPAEPCKPVAGGSEPPDSRSLLRQRLAALTFTVGDGSSAPFKVVALEDIDNVLNQYAAAGRPPPAWQPISTAPIEEATTVLLGWFDPPAAPMYRVGFWHAREQVWCDTHRRLHNAQSHPTHWHPLPTPPEAPTAQGENKCETR